MARLALADMRSLERSGLQQIFAPLDPTERLPRELLLEDRPAFSWGLKLGRQQVAGFMWAPALIATLAVVTWIVGNVLVALVSAAALLVAFSVFAFGSRR